MKFKNIIIYLCFFAILGACSDKKSIVPTNMVARLSSAENDLAVTQAPDKNDAKAPCENEFGFRGDSAASAINTSKYYLKNLLGETAAKNVDAVSFLTDSSGFFSVSHPPDSLYAAKTGFPYGGIVGGTDLFYFYPVNGKIKFVNLGDKINSPTWDSHPCAVHDNKGNIFLVWSSDRKDNKKGFSSPFLFAKNLQGADTLLGNSDLYFAFGRNGKWSAPHNFNSYDKKINTNANEETPFITCLCFNSKLLFATNRDNKDASDYDIWSADIKINFDSQTFDYLSEPKMLGKKGDQELNTTAKEFFPFVPKPYPVDNNGDGAVYVSSDRFDKPVKINDDTELKNKGKFDVYKFPYDKKCSPPEIKYVVVIYDSVNKTLVNGPVKIDLQDDRGGPAGTSTTNPAVFTLKYDRKYSATGSAMLNEIRCTGQDSSIQNYKFQLLVEKDPIISDRIEKTKYDTIIGSKLEIVYDTVLTVRSFDKKDASLIKSTPESIIQKIDMQGDNFIVSFNDIIRRENYIDGKKVTRTRETIVYDTVRQFDREVYISYEKAAPSAMSQEGKFPHEIYEKDVTLYDTINVGPEYFNLPPCKWEYIGAINDYRRNVPYFQTGFWEVNTKENLERHINELRSKQFNDASFIELQPENQYFGYRRGGLTDEQQESRKRRWENRVNEYRAYAREVEKNIKEMCNEIALGILPKFKVLDSIMPQLDNKLVVQIEAYSDFRPILGGKYLTDETVSYLSGGFNENTHVFDKMQNVKFEKGAILDEQNDVLSKLRAYFGYKELVKRLKKYELFGEYYKNGLVLLADECKSPEEFTARAAKAKIIVLATGRKVDEKAVAKVEGYRRMPSDYYDLDSARRVNVIINRVQFVNGQYIRTECCSEKSNRLAPAKIETTFNVQNVIVEKPSDPNSAPTGEFSLFFGAFRNINLAQKVVEDLQGMGISSIKITQTEIDDESYFQIIGPTYENQELANSEAIRYTEKMRKAGINLTVEVRKK